MSPRWERPADEHARHMTALADGAGLVGRPTAATWCPVHRVRLSPSCSSCAGDHAAGEHRGRVPVATCARCVR